MGYSLTQMVRAIFRTDNGLNEHEKIVMTCLAQHADEKGTCFPSISLVAKECSVSRRTVLRAIDGLAKKGWVIVQKRNGCVTTYTCRIPSVTSASQTPVSDSHQCLTVTGASQSPDQCLTVTGSPVSDSHRCLTDTGPVPDRHRTGVPQTPEVTHITNPITNSSYNVDVNIDAIDQEMEDAEDDVRKVEEHFLRRRGKGLMLSPLDESEIRKLLDEGIPVDVILRGIDRAFDQYQPKYQGDSISSFRYCVPVIRGLWAELSRPKPTGTLIRGRGRGGRRYVKRDYENMVEQLREALAQRKPKPASAYLPDMWGNAAAGSGAQAAVDGQVGLL